MCTYTWPDVLDSTFEYSVTVKLFKLFPTDNQFLIDIYHDHYRILWFILLITASFISAYYGIKAIKKPQSVDQKGRFFAIIPTTIILTFGAIYVLLKVFIRNTF